MDHREKLGYLFGLKPQGSKLGIDRMRLLTRELGDPDRDLPCVHIGGTNGKGSVAAMVESILRAAGWRVGLYTSPHLVDVGERVQVNRTSLTPEEIDSYVDELLPVSDRIAAQAGPDSRPSFFELMTAMAFLQFNRTRCDIAVIEVGMGGEFDATNVVLPEVSVITSVGLDHCEWLGHTVEEIARTKAGIVKPRRPIVIGRLPGGAERVVREIASWNEAPVISVREKFGEDAAGYPDTNLEGEYQRWNAATAALVVEALPPRWRVPPTAVRDGLASVRWKGRWEKCRVGGRLMVLDTSHNPEGAEILEMNLRQLVAESGRRPVVIVGVLGAARARPLLQVISSFAREIELVVPKEPRALRHEELEALLPSKSRPLSRRASVEELFPQPGVCTAGGPDDIIVVTGSIYLLGEVLVRLGREDDPIRREG